MLEKYVSSSPERFWARINERRLKDNMSHIHNENGQMLVDEVEFTERWKKHMTRLYGDMERTDQDVSHSEAAEEDDLKIMVEEVRRCVKRLKI